LYKVIILRRQEDLADVELQLDSMSAYDEVRSLKTRLRTNKNGGADEEIHYNFEIDPSKERYPFSLVWGSLPCLTWLCPAIGHMGICDSKGRIHDFAGPYTICIDDFMVGSVVKYQQIDPRTLDFPSLKSGEAKTHAEAWDLAIQKGDAQYKQMIHTLCWNNCHSHVRYCRNIMGGNQSTVVMFIKFVWSCRYVSVSRMLCTYLPFLILVGIFVFLSFLGRF